MEQVGTEETPAAIRRSGGWRDKFWQRVAACLVGGLPVLVPVFLIYVGPWLFAESWVDRARDLHEEWLETGEIANAELLDGRTYLSGLRHLGPVPFLPDFSEAQLRMARVSYIPAAEGRAAGFHVGYVGRAACRVSLWITPANETDDPTLQLHRGDPAASWATGGLRYVLVTEDMHKAHFGLLAVTGQDMTLQRVRPPEAVRAALRLSSVISPPCDD